jgi:predicted PurR-regulated permease PerM
MNRTEKIGASYDATCSEVFKGRARFVVSLIVKACALLVVVWLARTVLLLFFAAILCALLLTTATDWARAKLKVPRGLALTLVALSGIGLASLGIWLRGSAVAEQFFKLQANLPIAAQKLFIQLQGTDWGRWLLDRLDDNTQQIGALTFATARIGGVVLTTATGAAALVVICIASVYLSVEPEIYLKGLRLITPSRYRGLVERCVTGAAIQLRWWLLAKLISMVAVGLLISIGLWLLRVPLAGTLGIIAALLTFIPNLGPILSALPAALLAFAISPTKGLLTLSLFALVHFIEGNFVTPLAERGIVKLPPALTLAVQLCLGSITGALGIALAAPLTAAVLGIVMAASVEQSTVAAESQPMNDPQSARFNISDNIERVRTG